MSARLNAASNSIPGSEVELTRNVHWRRHGSLGFEGASICVHDAFGNTVDDVVPVAASSGVPSLVEDEDDWNLRFILLSRNEDVCVSLFVDFMAIQT